MKLNLDKLQEKVMPVATKLSENKYLSAITDGLSGILPAIMVGAIATLLGGLPFEGYQSFMAPIIPYLNLAADFTIDIIALILVFFIASNMANKFNVDGNIPGLLGLISFLILTPLETVETEAGATAFISFEWLGATGMFVAIFVGLIVGRVYVALVKKGLVIKMPDGVPPTISKAFGGMIPGFVIAAGALIIKALFDLTAFGSVHALIYHYVQTPLQSLGGSFGALLLCVFVVHFLWLFGIHGMLVVLSVMMPIWMSLDLENLTAYQNGDPLPNIVGLAFIMTYVLLGGSGATLGLNMLMLRAKSKRFKTLGGLAFPAGICGINEPIIFGTPIILNPLMAIPFILSPMVVATLAYVFTVIGIVPEPSGVSMALGTPIIMTGFLQGSWRIVVLQVLLVFVAALIYYPFFKMADKQAYEQETAGAEAATGSEN